MEGSEMHVFYAKAEKKNNTYVCIFKWPNHLGKFKVFCVCVCVFFNKINFTFCWNLSKLVKDFGSLAKTPTVQKNTQMNKGTLKLAAGLYSGWPYVVDCYGFTCNSLDISKIQCVFTILINTMTRLLMTRYVETNVCLSIV